MHASENVLLTAFCTFCHVWSVTVSWQLAASLHGISQPGRSNQSPREINSVMWHIFVRALEYCFIIFFVYLVYSFIFVFTLLRFMRNNKCIKCESRKSYTIKDSNNLFILNRSGLQYLVYTHYPEDNNNNNNNNNNNRMEDSRQNIDTGMTVAYLRH